MALKKTGSTGHPKLEDFNRIYGARHVHKLAKSHAGLKRRFRLGDHVEHVPGIESEDIRYWRAHMRLMPQLLRTLMQETIHHSLSGGKPMPIAWSVKPRRAGGWAISVTERGGKLQVVVTPPPLREPAAKGKRRKT